MKIAKISIVSVLMALLVFSGCTNKPVEGVKIIYSIEAENNSDEAVINEVKDIIGKRIKALYSKKYSIEVDKTNPYNPWIVVKIQQETDAKSIGDILGMTANLQFVEPDGTIILDGKDILDAKSMYGFGGHESNEYYIQLTLSDLGSTKFADATERQIGQHISILLDDNLILTPSVTEKIETKNPIILGNYTREDADELADLISVGALPFKLKMESAEHMDNINE